MDRLILKGKYEIQAVDLKGREVWKKTYNNLITSFVYSSILKYYNYTEEGPTPAATLLDLNYFAFGTGTTAAAESDTTLGTEIARKLYTSKSWTGKTFQALCQLGTAEANGEIKELGVFANGTATTDSGDLLSRAIVSISKNSNLVFNIRYLLTLGA